jgi:hypothetical protein
VSTRKRERKFTARNVRLRRCICGVFDRTAAASVNRLRYDGMRDRANNKGRHHRVVLTGFEAWWPFLNLSAAHFAVEGLSRVAKVSNFDHTAPARKHMLVLGMLGCRRVPMLITDQFWQYAKEAMLSAYYAKTDDDKQALLDLAQTWTQAALLERQCINYDSPAETSAA